MINASLLLGFSSGCQNSSNWWRRAGYKFLLVESRHKAACCQRKQDSGGHGPQWPMTKACIKSVEDMNQDKILSKATENWEKVGGMRTKKKSLRLVTELEPGKGCALNGTEFIDQNVMVKQIKQVTNQGRPNHCQWQRWGQMTNLSGW